MADEQKGRRSSRSVGRQDICAPGDSVPAETWRVFCAVELPLEVRRRIVQHAERLRSQLPEVRASWIREENLHVTLKFFGDLPLSRLESLVRAAERSTQAVQPFAIRLEGCGSFPPRGAPRVLWMGIQDSTNGLDQLYRVLEHECAAVGCEKEQRPFHPHLTVARVRHPQGASELARLHKETEFGPIDVPVSELVIIRSELGSSGSRYTEISRQSLKPGRAGEE